MSSSGSRVAPVNKKVHFFHACLVLECVNPANKSVCRMTLVVLGWLVFVLCWLCKSFDG